jgi:hypothetical protein
MSAVSVERPSATAERDVTPAAFSLLSAVTIRKNGAVLNLFSAQRIVDKAAIQAE